MLCDPTAIVGILLSAGKGRRFDPSGRSNKLLAPLPDGMTVIATAAARLRAVVPVVIAPVRSDAPEVGRQLKSAGCTVLPCPVADSGMGDVLAFSVRHVLQQWPDASACLVALGDMPYVRSESIMRIVAALESQRLVVPTFEGRPGHPVGFCRSYFDRLATLSGDRGARELVMAEVGEYRLPLTDSGVVDDIDCQIDLHDGSRYGNDWRRKPL